MTPPHLENHRADHTPEAIQRRLDAPAGHSALLRDFIYGAIDGAVTTFAIVAGVAGAQLSASIVIILGLANLLADGFSMAASNFVAVRTENQQLGRARNIEKKHIEEFPAGEEEEIRQIFARKGFDGEDLERVVEVITADVERWVDTMVTEEHGLPLEHPSATKAASATFVAFVITGAIPLVPYVWMLLRGATPTAELFLWSSVLTGVAFFAVGALKSRFVEQKWWIGGLETFAIGGAAAAVAYGIGAALQNGISTGAG